MPYLSRRYLAWALRSEALGDKIDKVGGVIGVDLEPLAIAALTGEVLSEGAFCLANIGEIPVVMEVEVSVGAGRLIGAEAGHKPRRPPHLAEPWPCGIGDDVEVPAAVVAPLVLSACRASSTLGQRSPRGGIRTQVLLQLCGWRLLRSS